MAISPPSAYDLAQLDALTDEQRFWVAAGFNQGYSGNAIQQTLSDAGIGVRRGDLQAALRALNSVSQLAQGINNTPLPLQPSLTQFPSSTHTLGYNYIVRGFVDALNLSTGETERVYSIKGFDTIGTRQQILEAMAETMSPAALHSNYTFDTTSIVITSAYSSLR